MADMEVDTAVPGTSKQPHGDEEYEVEEILDHKLEDGTTLYRVHWRGYNSDDDTWEPRDNLRHCTDKLRAYEVRKGLRQPKLPRYEYVPEDELRPKDPFWQNAERGELPAELRNVDKFSIVKSRSQKKASKADSSVEDVAKTSSKSSSEGKKKEIRTARKSLESQLNASRKSGVRADRSESRSSRASNSSTDYSWSSNELADNDGLDGDGQKSDRSGNNTDEYEYIEPESDSAAGVADVDAARPNTMPGSSRKATSIADSAKAKAKPKSKDPLVTNGRNAATDAPNSSKPKAKASDEVVSRSRTVELLAPYGLVKLTDPAELRTLFELPAISNSQLEAFRRDAASNAKEANQSLTVYLNNMLRDAVLADDFEKLARLCKLASSKRRGADGVEQLQLDFEQVSTSVGLKTSDAPGECYTLVQIAVLLGNAYTVDLLAQRGANLNASSVPSGLTALMLAAERGFDEIVTLLISFGAHVNATTNTIGETALYRAVKQNKARCVDILVRCGANLNGCVKAMGMRRGECDTPLNAAQRIVEPAAAMRTAIEKMSERAKHIERSFVDAVRAEIRGALVLVDGETPLFPLQCVAVRDLDSLRDSFSFEFAAVSMPSDFFEDVSYGYVLFIARANLFSEKLEMDLGDTRIIDSIELNCVKQPFITETYGFAAYSLAPLRSTRNQMKIQFIAQAERRSRLGSMHPVLSLVIGAYKVRLVEQT